jgi:L-threonylcarbamoyladenylate synthase
MIAAPTPEVLDEATALLLEGQLVAFPTETVYGLGADGFNPGAVQLLYRVKGRPANNPLIFHVASIEAAREWVADWPEEAEALARAFWPGPLTLVLPVRADLDSPALAGGRTIALRVPDHPVARALLQQVGRPIVAPSANKSGGLSPVEAEHVASYFEGEIPLILDGGVCSVGVESTVVDVTTSPARLLRPGFFTLEDLQRHVPVEALQGTPGNSAEPLRSPGLLTRHYAPRIPVQLNAEKEHMRTGTAWVRFVEEEALLWELTEASGILVFALGSTPHQAEAQLYAALWEAQTTPGMMRILIDPIPAGSEWDAIRDRLTRAAAQ